jgi:formate hydrogenlyase subunit 3/multisubunit Na+/H+ antiporter MnhD subunit
MANNPSTPPARPAASSSISAEALIGIGMTVAWLGILGVMLGWAEWLRQVPTWAAIWLVLGVVCLVVGALTAMAGSRKKR